MTFGEEIHRADEKKCGKKRKRENEKAIESDMACFYGGYIDYCSRDVRRVREEVGAEDADGA